MAALVFLMEDKALTGQNELTGFLNVRNSKEISERPENLQGFLAIDKPAGKTSHDICMIVKRMLNVSKTSHSGTLDPMVTGVLVMGLGRAARLL